MTGIQALMAWKIGPRASAPAHSPDLRAGGPDRGLRTESAWVCHGVAGDGRAPGSGHRECLRSQGHGQRTPAAGADLELFLAQALLPPRGVHQAMQDCCAPKSSFTMIRRATKVCLDAHLDEAHRLLFHVHILCFECRWKEVGAAIAMLPAPYRAAPAVQLIAMRERYEDRDFEGVLTAYQHLRAGFGPRTRKDTVDQVQRTILGMTGAVDQLRVLGRISSQPRAFQDYGLAVALWAAGHEAEARSLLESLTRSSHPRVVISASYRLAHPPPLANELPIAPRELGMAMATTMSSVRVKKPAVTAMLVANVLMYGITVALTVWYEVVGNLPDEVSFDQALQVLGGFSPLAFSHDYQPMALALALFLHASRSFISA